ncbi:MAG: NAD(P)H-dependent flavin oxidoreductase [Gammaproteobacteria bacterium]
MNDNPVTHQLGIDLPIICGPMYPCSNPELVAAASAAGGMGVVQPISMTYVHGHDFRQGLRYIRSLTDSPIGFNALIEASSKRYLKRMEAWLDIALEEGVRFVITSLGRPDWVVERVHAVGGVVYHDVTKRQWAEKGVDSGVDGLICVNNRAGGHTGMASAEALLEELASIDLPKICAGGVATAEDVRQAISMGYDAVQLGTAFIATDECSASDAYKQAIVQAAEADIRLTRHLTGVPVSVIGRAGANESRLLSRLADLPQLKKVMRVILMLRAMRGLKRTLAGDSAEKGYWQAGKSVEGVNAVRPVADLMAELARGL